MKRAACLLLPLVLAACESRPLSSTSPIPRALPVLPTVEAVRAPIDQARVSNVRLRDELQAARVSAQSSAEKAAEATEQARQLAEVGTADKAQLSGLWKSLQDLSAAKASMLDEISRMTALIEDQAKALAAAQSAQAKAEQSAAAGDVLADAIARDRDLKEEERNQALKLAATREDDLAVSESNRRFLLKWAGGVTALVLLYCFLRLKRIVP